MSWRRGKVHVDLLQGIICFANKVASVPLAARSIIPSIVDILYKEELMRKTKIANVSQTSDRLPNCPTKRILLSRETIRTLTSEELSQVAGGCPTGSSPTLDPGI
jgi:hypothetical protein